MRVHKYIFCCLLLFQPEYVCFSFFAWLSLLFFNPPVREKIQKKKKRERERETSRRNTDIWRSDFSEITGCVDDRTRVNSSRVAQ